MATTNSEQRFRSEQRSTFLRPPLARLLREEGLVTQEQVDHALAEGESSGERLGEILLRRNLVDERQLASLLARQWQLSFVDEPASVDATTLAVLSAEDARRLRAVPVRSDDGTLRVVIAEPNEERLAGVRARVPEDVELAVTTPSVFQRLLALLEAPQRSAEEQQQQPTDHEATARGFDGLVALLDDETAHLEALREKVAQFAGAAAEREQTIRRLESELDAERNARAHDRLTIDRLQREVDDRTRLVELARRKAEELAAALRGGGV